MNRTDVYALLFKLDRVGISGDHESLIESMTKSVDVPEDVTTYLNSKVDELKEFLSIYESKKLYKQLSSTNIDEKCTALSSFMTRLSIENEKGNHDIAKLVELLIDVRYVHESVLDRVMRSTDSEYDVNESARVIKGLIDSRNMITIEDI